MTTESHKLEPGQIVTGQKTKPWEVLYFNSWFFLLTGWHISFNLTFILENMKNVQGE